MRVCNRHHNDRSSMGVCVQGFTTLGGSKSLSKAQLDNLFTFSHDLGASYSGVWVTPRRIVITVLDVTGAGPPPILEFRIQVAVLA
jgi:hypothetical protein